MRPAHRQGAVTPRSPMPDAALTYPIETPPAPGQVLEVAAGVRWLRMPLPFKLDHINLWAIADGDGWAVVDTGVRHDDALSAWERVLADGLDGRPLTRVIVTHMHPDHVGLAGWLCTRFHLRLWMTRLEYIVGRMLTGDTGRPAPPEGTGFYRACGWSASALSVYEARFGDFGRFIYPMPAAYERLVDGQVLRIGGHDWEVIVGSGHSPEHACLHCRTLGVLISGDQVLPTISSNVSVHPTEPEADPMREWKESLGRVRARVGNDVLVLPAHGRPFRGLHARIAQLEQSTARAEQRLLQALQRPLRVVDTFEALFGRAIGETSHALFSLATGEAVASLNHLRFAGRVRRRIDADGVAWHEVVGAGAAG